MDQRMRAPSMLMPSVGGSRRRRGHQLRFRPWVFGFVRSGEIVESPPQAGLRVDQELPGRDNVLANSQPFENLGATAVLSADLDPHRAKMCGIVSHNHNAVGASYDHGLRRYRQHLIL